MLEHVRDDVLPAGITQAKLRREVERMRLRFDALVLPVVNGHGDLKPCAAFRDQNSSNNRASGQLSWRYCTIWTALHLLSLMRYFGDFWWYLDRVRSRIGTFGLLLESNYVALR